MAEIIENTGKKVLSWYTIAYDDYLASRCLLNNDHCLQGAILASTSIEKYLKGVLTANNVSFKFGHFDKDDYFEKLFEKVPQDYNILKIFDPHFLEIIKISYKFRYIEHSFKEPTSIGFFINQFLCELDSIVHTFENMIKMGFENGDELKSPYWRDVDASNPKLCLNNFHYEKIKKVDFMLRESDAYGIMYDTNKDILASLKNIPKISVLYPNNNIMILRMKMDS